MSDVGQNFVEPSETAKIAYHLSRLMEEKDKKASSDGTYRSYLSRLESKGINLKAAKEAVKIHKSEKTEETVVYLQKLFGYLKVLGTPLELKQAELFPVADLSQTPEQKAEENGLGAGMLGYNLDHNPYQENSDLGQIWMEAWHKGCAERTAAKALDEAADDDETLDSEDLDGSDEEPDEE